MNKLNKLKEIREDLSDMVGESREVYRERWGELVEVGYSSGPDLERGVYNIIEDLDKVIVSTTEHSSRAIKWIEFCVMDSIESAVADSTELAHEVEAVIKDLVGDSE